ncbi:MAG: type II and III secretion system protein family protein [Acidobacteriota bacterium]
MTNKLRTVFLITFIPLFIASVLDARPAAAFQDPSAGLETLRVYLGRSLVVDSQQSLARVSVSSPAVASAVITSPKQVLIHGLAAGSVSLVLWDDQGNSRSFDLRVELNLAGLKEELAELFPGTQINVTQSGNSVVLAGNIASAEQGDRAVLLAKTYSPNVVNLLQLPPRGPERAVLLQVRFAEVDRTAIQELGLNLFSTGAGNTFGSVTTQQFDSPQASVGALPRDVQAGSTPRGNSIATGAIGNQLHHQPGVFGLGDLLNVFLFRSDVNLGLTLRALQQRNVLQILAEPNVLALNGREASFLAGGEFPFPVVQGGTNFTAVTIQFREFGVRLRFTPTIQADGTILLKVAPEVSSLDFSNALTISGFLVPALSTRKAETEVALRDGQSFAIAGLIDKRMVEIASKVPFLGDIPGIGKLFRSRSQERNNTELLVLVSPKIVNPLEPGETPPLPAFPKSFLDEKEFGRKFDGKLGEAVAQTAQNR